jgi:selenocysteine-specific elongation factor
MSSGLHVVATAGHVDHGKSSLILRLTGIDPDRLAEEKRRGLTIDLGFAWTTLPSGREIGFVDVPGHERFVRTMLAGVGPVRLVLFVVAADEGWKPQSEEHLQIVNLLEADDAVIALTKRDLVDDATLRRRVDEVRGRFASTRLAGTPIVPCSAVTGEGIDELGAALDAMVAAAPEPDRDERPRLFIDRAFTIRGSGTVVTGTLTGGPISVGDEAEIMPSGHRARIRALQSHRRAIDRAVPVSRVAVNLVGTAKDDLDRGDVLSVPGAWRPTSLIEGWIRPVPGLPQPVSGRGAFKLHAGSAERDARLRPYGGAEVTGGGDAFVRITLARPVVLAVGDPFVLRDAGRRATVAGGRVLDVDPPKRPGPDAIDRLRGRMGLQGEALARRLVVERGAVRADDLLPLTGVRSSAVATAENAVVEGGWLLAPGFVEAFGQALGEALGAHHAAHPLQPGLESGEARAWLARHDARFQDASLAHALISHLARTGSISVDGAHLRLPTHHRSTAGRDDADRLVAAVAAGEPTPPSLKDLAATGFGAELIRAACADGRLVRIAPDLVVTPEFLARATETLRELGNQGDITVSAFREALGTSRRFALPILEHFDARGLTKRQGDVRVLREVR